MITYLIATTGRPGLAETLASIECWPGDEIIVAGKLPADVYHPQLTYLACPPGNDWGHSERNFAMPYARGSYIANIDDDDVYVPGTRARFAKAIADHPGKPSVFRMQYPNGLVLWRYQLLQVGNIGTPMTLWPNMPEKFGTWGPTHEGDFHFFETMRWPELEFRWWPHVIAQIGHNP